MWLHAFSHCCCCLPACLPVWCFLLQGIRLCKYIFPPLVWLVDRTPGLRGRGLGLRLPSPLLRYVTFKLTQVGESGGLWLGGSYGRRGRCFGWQAGRRSLAGARASSRASDRAPAAVVAALAARLLQPPNIPAPSSPCVTCADPVSPACSPACLAAWLPACRTCATCRRCTT